MIKHFFIFAFLTLQGALLMAEDTLEKTQIVLIDTSMGPIELTLYPEKAPVTVANFVNYAKNGQYNGTIFHRVIDGFMIQGGGFTPDMKQKDVGAPIKNEAANGLKNKRGSIAMARTSVVDSATAQFFINVSDNDFLNYRAPTDAGYGYAVFGEVTKGMDTVDKIKAVKTLSKPPHQDVPVQPVIINSITVK